MLKLPDNDEDERRKQKVQILAPLHVAFFRDWTGNAAKLKTGIFAKQNV